MSPGNDRIRPAQADSVSNSVPTTTDSVYDVRAVCEAYVVLVQTTDEKMRRRVMLSLHSAEKAVRRAELRGHSAELVLCRLIPVLPEPEDTSPSYFRLPIGGDDDHRR